MKSNADKVKSCFKKIFEGIVALNNEHKIAVLLTYQSKTGQLVFGSKHVKQKMRQAFDCTCECVCEGEVKTWEGAFKDDNMELIQGTQLMEVGGDGDDIVDTVQAESTMVAKLPCKLELMNYRQCSDWIKTQILANHLEQGKCGSKIVMRTGILTFG